MERANEITGPVHLPLRIEDREVPFRLWYFEFPGEGRWAAVVAGEPDASTPMPLRIESACFFGHVFHSAKCDCGFQLDEALRFIARRGRGLVVYGIDQDARGLGIADHFKIYVLRQQENLDTDAVYERLQAPVDARTYDPVAVILRHLDIHAVLLLSNNPRRKAFLEQHGFAVQTQSLEAELDNHNMATLMLEKEDLGYEWSFKTHRDWLEPIQRQVDGAPATARARVVLDNQEVAAEHEDAGAWQLARGLAERFSRPAGRQPIVYLTDFPRVDELPIYAAMGTHFVVVPFPVIPAWLSGPATALGLKIQDWARKNQYQHPRPQWQLALDRGTWHIYVRDGHARCVFPDAASARDLYPAALARYEAAARAVPGAAPTITTRAPGPCPWFELAPPARPDAAALAAAGHALAPVEGAVVLALPETAAK